VVDLLRALSSAEASDIADFSLELLPSVLETKQSTGVQQFSIDGYSSIQRSGHVDALVLTEFAYDDELFEIKLADNELYYYGHERQREEERRLDYILVDASASMRGKRQVFARALALTLGKKFVLEGHETRLRFFDSRLHDLIKMSRRGSAAVPYVLTFRSERGRNYARVFRQLLFELMRMRREERRQIVLYIITHGECHIPLEVVRQLREYAFLYAVVILPSSDLDLEYLPLFHGVHVVSAESLRTREDRKDRALHIVHGSGAPGG